MQKAIARIFNSHRDEIKIGSLVIGWRLVLLVITCISMTLFGQLHPSPWPDTIPNSPSYLAAWDSGFYLSIAQYGYHIEPGRQSNVVFFPAYPILMKAGALVTGGNYLLAGTMISTIAFAWALESFLNWW